MMNAVSIVSVAARCDASMIVSGTHGRASVEHSKHLLLCEGGRQPCRSPARRLVSRNPQLGGSSARLWLQRPSWPKASSPSLDTEKAGYFGGSV
ncbi:uncharacterized protein BJX67DRAFT_347249 [Aspergillus lucknowensis]|uniref:Uncharacterized protein n=1 Tax=Aspergillus lucknowensis TaxID=176173 RepID=A0ABR4M0F2_9EURO